HAYNSHLTQRKTAGAGRTPGGVRHRPAYRGAGAPVLVPGWIGGLNIDRRQCRGREAAAPPRSGNYERASRGGYPAEQRAGPERPGRHGRERASMSRSFLEVDDIDPARLAGLLDRAAKWKRDPASVPPALAGKGVAALFEKPSARTRISIEMAVWTLGGHPIYVRGEEVGLDTRESVEDVARTMAGMCTLIAARVFDHRVLERMDAVVDVPVVNLLSDRAHPCQALADLLTLREHFQRLEGLRIAFVGDGNNVAASLAFGAALSGVELVVASPEGYELDPEVVARARNLGGTIE